AAVVYEPTTGFAEGARATVAPTTSAPPSIDLARLALEQANALATDLTQTERALAHYRACLALEETEAAPALFQQARQQLQRLQARLAPKGTVNTLAAKVEPVSEPSSAAVVEVVVPSSRPSRAISVGPDGLVYDEEP
ncbi:MAG: hypothetical protein SNJ82_08150, partial [Gemmataceae bacterium]